MMWGNSPASFYCICILFPKYYLLKILSFLLCVFVLPLLKISWICMFACMSPVHILTHTHEFILGDILSVSLFCEFLCQYCWVDRGSWRERTQGRKEQMKHMKGFTHSEREWQDTWPEGWWPTGKILFFSASFIQKRKRLKHQNHYDLVTAFLFWHFYCQCPWLSINFFSVKWNHLVFLPTMIETWHTCRFRPCHNAAKPQWPCQTVAFDSQHSTILFWLLYFYNNI
jgi:hypothetical protein